jgi:DNA repair exonuclease SbcCD ATPase subunit
MVQTLKSNYKNGVTLIKQSMGIYAASINNYISDNILKVESNYKRIITNLQNECEKHQQAISKAKSQYHNQSLNQCKTTDSRIDEIIASKNNEINQYQQLIGDEQNKVIELVKEMNKYKTLYQQSQIQADSAFKGRDIITENNKSLAAKLKDIKTQMQEQESYAKVDCENQIKLERKACQRKYNILLFQIQKQLSTLLASFTTECNSLYTDVAKLRELHKSFTDSLINDNKENVRQFDAERKRLQSVIATYQISQSELYSDAESKIQSLNQSITIVKQNSKTKETANNRQLNSLKETIERQQKELDAKANEIQQLTNNNRKMITKLSYSEMKSVLNNENYLNQSAIPSKSTHKKHYAMIRNNTMFAKVNSLGSSCGHQVVPQSPEEKSIEPMTLCDLSNS